MAAAIIRVGDLSTGHILSIFCHLPPTAALSGSPDVLIGGQAVMRHGDPYTVHCCGGVSPCHQGFGQATSSNILINGMAVLRQGDPITCGDHANTTHSDLMG